jgi:hypothetical protein
MTKAEQAARRVRKINSLQNNTKNGRRNNSSLLSVFMSLLMFS